MKRISKKKAKAEEIKELKSLLLPRTGREDAGILELAEQHLTSDLNKNRIARIRVLVERL